MATNPNAALFQRSTVSKTTTYTATIIDDIILCDTSGGAWTLTLPPAASLAGKELTIFKTTDDVNALTIDGNASETINAIASIIVPRFNNSVTLFSTGTAWLIIQDKRTIRVEGAGNAAAAITGDTEDIDWTVVEDICGLWTQSGSHGPDRCTPKEAGIYQLEGQANTTTNSTNRILVYKGGTLYKQINDANHGVRDHFEFSTTIALDVGDYFSIRFDVTETLENTTADHWLQITKIG